MPFEAVDGLAAGITVHGTDPAMLLRIASTARGMAALDMVQATSQSPTPLSTLRRDADEVRVGWMSKIPQPRRRSL